MNDLFLPSVSISSRSVVLYDSYQGERRTSSKVFNPYLRSKANTISKVTRKRLVLAINTLIDTAKYKTVFVAATQTYFRYKINFITLTLPSVQIHTDSQIVKECLSKFLEAWSKRRKGLLYVWKAETQDNGNLHFHITSNAFYHWKKLQTDWNRYINKLGYVDRAKSDTPNSTDVHSVSNVKNLSAYLASYVGKKDLYQKVLKRYHKIYDKYHKISTSPVCKLPKNYFKKLKRKVTCPLWSASKVLLKSKISIHRNHPDIQKDMEYLRENKHHGFVSDYCLAFNFADSIKGKLPELYKAFATHFKELIQKQSESVIAETIETL